VRLVVNADDLGLVESVNRGIVEAIENGVVTSTSLMVNMPGCDDAIARLQRLRESGKSVGVGLHFNVVSGAPLRGGPSLLDPGASVFCRWPSSRGARSRIACHARTFSVSSTRSWSARKSFSDPPACD